MAILIILTDGGRGTLTFELEDTRVSPVTSSRLTNTDPVVTSGKVVQRIDLKKKKFCTLILCRIIGYK